MKTLYLECGMGAAGDMLMAALLELIPDRQAFLDKMNSLGLPGVEVRAEPVVKCGITGTHMRVTVAGEEEISADVPHDHEHDHGEEHHHDYEHDHEEAHHHDHDHDHGEEHHHHHVHDHGEEHHHEHEHDHGEGHHHDHEHGHHHHHTSMADVEALLDGLAVSERVRADAKAVYGLIAQAESQVHGRPVSQIHFHEVGTMDAVADVVGVCLLMEMLDPAQVLASPVHVGSGHVHCAHGILPVPAPATALLLSGIPTYGGQVRGELCTPTGAALLRHFVSRFGDRPVMTTQAIGYGMGMKDFEQANCVRAFLGESESRREEITRLECNLDDMTGEELAFAMARLFEAGARDVYTQAIGMKKSRPGVLLSVICLPADADRLAGLMMRHTTTLGIRRQDMSRYVLSRGEERRDTPWGSVRVKVADGMGTHRWKAEFEDLAAIAEREGLSLHEVRREIREKEDEQK